MLHFKIFQYLFYYIISRKGFTIMTDIKFQGLSFWRIYFLYVLKLEGGGWRRGKDEMGGERGEGGEKGGGVRGGKFRTLPARCYFLVYFQ